MRVIKFRGYCNRDSEWRFGSYATDGENHEILTPLSNGSLYASAIAYDDIDSIGQFTGLHDKNGVEIYEGDICVWYINDFERVGEIYYHSQSFEMRSPSTGYIGWDANRGEIEVIGNIHETPELLK